MPKLPSDEVRGPEFWLSGRHRPKGIHSFLHIVRAESDPARLSREQRQKKHGAEVSQIWKKAMHVSQVPKWREEIIKLLEDGLARTFNRIVLEISKGEYTADVAMGKAPDVALWQLVTEWELSFTNESPVYFRLSRHVGYGIPETYPDETTDE